MTIIQRLLQPMRELREQVRSMGRGAMLLSQAWSRAFSVAVLTVTLTGFGLPLTAWTADVTSSGSVKPRKVGWCWL